jgi:hypothetical protein
VGPMRNFLGSAYIKPSEFGLVNESVDTAEKICSCLTMKSIIIAVLSGE